MTGKKETAGKKAAQAGEDRFVTSGNGIKVTKQGGKGAKQSPVKKNKGKSKRGGC